MKTITIVATILTIQRDNRRDVVTLITQLTIGIILNDRHTIFIGQVDQLLAAFEAEGRAARVLKIWKGINEFRSDAKRFFQFVHDHTVLIRADGDVLRSVGIPRLHRTKIGGRFHHNIIAAINEKSSDKVQCLLRTGGDQNILGAHLHTVAPGVPCDHFSQREIAFTGAVLQSLRAEMVEYIVAGFTEFRQWKDLRRWQTARKRNDISLLR